MFLATEQATASERKEEAFYIAVEKELGYCVGLLSVEAEIIAECWKDGVSVKTAAYECVNFYKPEVASDLGGNETYHP